jgi:hypothetical protein
MPAGERLTMDDGRFRFEEAFSVDFASGDLRIAGRLRDMPRLGWSFADPGVAERRWTVGPDGRVVIPLPAQPGRYVLELSLKVPDRNFQDWHRITVSANDRTLFEGVVPEATTLACPLPADLLQGPGPLSILVQQPEAATAPAHSPARRRMAYTRLRLLRFAGTEGAAEPGAVEDEIADPDTAPAAQLVTQFESLGDNCEFGIVQRRAGAEPLGLLRFSAMHLDRLLSGLADGYAGVESPAGIEPRLHGEPGGAPREYVVHQSPHGLVYHTYVLETQASAEQVRAQESVKLGFLQRKLMEDLEEGRKIFIFKRIPDLAEQEVLPLWAALRARGPNTLLWVVQADAAHPPGTVEWRMDGLMRGYIDRLAPYHDATDVSLACWLQICRNAYRLRSTMRRALRAAA